MEGEKEDAAQKFLDANPDTLKRLVAQASSKQSVLPPVSSEKTPLDASAIYERYSNAVVAIYTDTGSGSGFFLTSDGVVATNFHILGDANDAVVVLQSGELVPVSSVLACDDIRDYCIAKIAAADTPFLLLGDSDAVRVGEPIVVLGNPLGLNFSVSTGIISGIRDYEVAGPMLQFTAPISSGNSGGPVLNMFGEVLGMTQSSYTSSDVQNVNFAVPANALRESVESP